MAKPHFRNYDELSNNGVVGLYLEEKASRECSFYLHLLRKCYKPHDTRGKMRSELVYSAGIRIPNRFLLTTLTIKAVQSLHISSTRTEDTANRVFADVASGRFTDVKMPAVVIQPSMDPLLIASAA